MRFRERLKRVLEHPAVQCLVAASLIGTSAREVLAPFYDPTVGFALHAGHGMLIFGLVHGAKSLLDLLEGLDKIPARAVAEQP
jgi:hypothetical protein